MLFAIVTRCNFTFLPIGDAIRGKLGYSEAKVYLRQVGAPWGSSNLNSAARLACKTVCY